MDKKKNCRLNLSKGAVIGCLIAATAFSSIGVNAFAAESTSQTKQTKVMQDAVREEFFIDSDYKNYNDIKKAAKIAGFNFKVPDYAVDGFVADLGIDVYKFSDTENYVSLSFSNQDENDNDLFYYIDIYKGNAKDALEKTYEDFNNEYIVSKSDITSSEKTIGNIKGQDIIVTQARFDPKNPDDKAISVNKFFAWEDDGLSYIINYNSIAKYNNNEEQYVNVSEDNIDKIINSMKKPEEVTNVKYFSDRSCINVYDNEDLETASKFLGFTPKFISNIKDKMKITYAKASIHRNNKTVFEMSYNTEDDKYFLTIDEMKDDNDYNGIKNGSLNLHILYEDSKPSKSEKLTISNKDVYKIKENLSELYEEDEDEYIYVYMWEDNGIYYKITSYSQDLSFDDKLESVINDILSK